jgi:hypothetical protein
VAVIGLFLVVACLRAEPPRDPEVLERFPVSRDGGYLTVPVTIRGKAYPFVVDTGASQTLFDTFFLPLLGPRLKREEAQGANAKLEIDVFRPPEARVGRLPLSGEGRVAVSDLGWVRRSSGQEIRGILGMNFLRRYAVRIDFDAGLLILSRRAGRPESERMPLYFDERTNLPMVEASVCAGGAPPERFVVDTGCDRSGNLRADLFRILAQLGQLQEVIPVFSASLGHEGFLARGRLACLRLGPFEHRRLLTMSSLQSNLGLDYWSRYDVTFDFPGGHVYLRKGKDFNRPEWLNCTGLHLCRHSGETFISVVDAGSPAARAGARPGDIVVSIGGLRPDKQPTAAVGRQFRTPNKTVSLSLKRRGELLCLSVQADAAWGEQNLLRSAPGALPTEGDPGASTPPSDALRALIRRAIEAHGGRQALEQLKRYHWSGRCSRSVGVQTCMGRIECWTQQRGQLRIAESFRSDTGESLAGLTVCNGGRTWQSIEGATTEVPRGINSVADYAYYTWLLPLLDDPEVRLSELPATRVEGKPAEGLRVAAPGRAAASLYFDKASHLLVMVENTLYSTDGKAIPCEHHFRDYQTVQGVRWAMTRMTQGGPIYSETYVEEVTFPKEIDSALFAKP